MRISTRRSSSLWVLVKKPVVKNGREMLVPVIVKIGRNGLDREFLMGRTVLGVAIISSHYWAPHSKLAPFLAVHPESELDGHSSHDQSKQHQSNKPTVFPQHEAHPLPLITSSTFYKINHGPLHRVQKG